MTAEQAADATDGLALRIVNPLPGGLPLRFANEYAEKSFEDWWLLP